MRRFAIGVSVVCIAANMVIAKPPTPGYSQELQQKAEMDSMRLFQTKNPLFQTCRQVVVKFLQRPLSFVGGSVAQRASGGTAAHVQIVAYDKKSGQIIDNFGLTGDPIITKSAKIFSESPAAIISDYDQNSLGEVEMSSDCYERVRNMTQAQLSDAYYSALNNVDLKSSMVAGTVMGAATGGGVTSEIVGGIAGAKVAVSEYDKDGRRNYKIVSDKSSQMSFPGLNCQSAVDIFLKNGVGEETWRVIKEYRQPGEMIDEANATPKISGKKCLVCGADLNADGTCPKAAKISSVKRVDTSQEATPPVGRDMTDEEAIRLLREDGSGIKAVADALKD